MAESKGALIAKSVQKHAGRAKEKLLQNLGKVDRTADDIFDEHLQNFNRQQQQATRLQKEFNNYIRCIRAAQTAHKSLMEAISEVYESGWSGHDLLYVQAQHMEMLWQDYSHKLGDQVLIPLNTYTSQFPEMKKKIEKRGRKLVDYDSQRHSFQSLQANSNKRRDDVKLTRGRELLEEAKRTYEVLNSELHDELPALYDSRLLFLVSNLQTLFSAEHLFHNESSKVYSELEAITDKLANESQRGSYTVKKMVHNNITASPVHTNGNAASPTQPPRVNGASTPEETESEGPREPKGPREPEVPREAEVPRESEGPREPPRIEIKEEVSEDEIVVPDSPIKKKDDVAASAPPQDAVDGETTVEELYDIPVGATVAGLPAGVLYRVRATYRYTREDADELSFDVGDIIRVVPYEDPDEQEEGWLMGIKEGSNEKGMFPANFTRPI